MENILNFFGPWTWFIIGVVLLLFELAATGVFFIWLGAAAIVTGLIDLIIPMSWQIELAVFASLSVIFVLVGRPIVMKRINLETDQPNLNKRNQNFIGRRYQLSEPVKGGRGTLKINDTLWRIRGEDSPQGTWVKITAVDGMELVVEADEG
ncbi:hypothetical protein MNBD_ALPHA08-1376 [hydrothermal vent metagenome]|uniref:NfeD-like C-terminal domain-containing protein n=1 Tax=hydrothermal vent metagenome TaxID=652676 RepID=A0A3B0SKK8_9ZZZZ